MGWRGIIPPSAAPKEEKKDFLSELLARMNDLFGLDVTDGDKLDWVQGMVSKLSENGPDGAGSAITHGNRFCMAISRMRWMKPLSDEWKPSRACR